MGFLKNVLSLFKRETKSANMPASPRVGGSSAIFNYVSAPAMTIAAVFRCVKLLSESIANLPMEYQVNRNGIFTADHASNLHYLLNIAPNESVNAFDFWRQVGQELLLDGNAYIIPFHNLYSSNMEVTRLVLCNRNTVSHDVYTDTYVVDDYVNGISATFKENEIIHLKGLTGNNAKQGVSVLSYARMTLDIAGTGDSETRNRFANGGNVRGIVTNDTSVRGFGEYQDIELEKTAISLDERFSNGEHIVSLPGDAKFQALSLSSADLQFLESRKFTVREICRFFGVHPSFVFDDTSNNYKSAEQANGAFLTHTLNPMLRNIEIELLRKLVPAPLAHRYRFIFDRSALYACDLDGMMNYRAKRLQIGASVNEVRQMDNLPPVEGGDVVLVSANLKSVNELSAQAQPKTFNYDPNDEEQ